MANKNFMIVLAVLVVVIVVGIAALIYTNPNLINSTSTPTPTPQLSPQEQVREATIAYIKANRTETAQYLTSLSWSGGRATPEGLLGAETYIYTSGNWNLTITYPVIPNPTYNINAIYTSTDLTINWHGAYTNGTVTETSYSHNP
jgi:hypothetical protein